jgi:hypothetical protein
MSPVVLRSGISFASRPAYTGGAGDFHQGPYVGAKMDALRLYYNAQDNWLDSKAGESVERIIQGFHVHYHAHMEACQIKDWKREQRETARAAVTWLS